MPRIEDRVIEIPEYGTKDIFGLNPEVDIPYLKKPCFNVELRRPYRVTELKNDSVQIENTSYSGIIQLENYRIHFSTKVKTNLFYMLSFLKHEDCFFYDPEVIIDIKEGENFFDILGRFFLNELDDIYRKGIYKTYVRKVENISFVKGRIIFSGQIANDYHKRAKIFCSYDDLTYDNQENRIVLKAATLLAPLIKYNQEIKRELIRYSYILREDVSLVDVRPEECDKVQFSRLNDHYESILQFSKIILQNYYIKSVQVGHARGFNFIVNMNVVYEDFITQLIEEVVADTSDFHNLIVEKQERFDTLVKERRIITRPDVILRIRNSDKYPLIIDAKYKRQPTNVDYYQAIAYALAIPSSRACCLIYPFEEDVDEKPLTLQPRQFGSERDDIILFPLRIKLFMEEEIGFTDYISKIKEQIYSILGNVLTSVPLQLI